MRLNSKELSAIINAFSKILHDQFFQLYLFGSRTDDMKKGGDIDLLIVVQNNLKSTVIDKKTEIRSIIFDRIPEQKIDITVATIEDIKLDPFLNSIYPDCILLHEHSNY